MILDSECSSYNLRHEWNESCSEALGYRLQLNDNFCGSIKDGNDDNSEILMSLLEDEEPPFPTEASIDSETHERDNWTDNACRIYDSLRTIMDLLHRRGVSYVSPPKFCDDAGSNDDSSLLESTILSFVATTANQIESLRQAIRGDNLDYQQHCNGIVSHLMGVLKEDIANPFAQLQRQRRRTAMMIWEDPYQCRLVNPGHDSSDELRFLPSNYPIYQDTEFGGDTYRLEEDHSAEISRPESLFATKKQHSNITKEIAPLNMMSPGKKNEFKIDPKRSRESTLIKSSYTLDRKDNDEENDYRSQLERESVLLTTTLQTEDWDMVQQAEARMTEITALLAQFSALVAEQQAEVATIHETTVQSHRHVEQGQEQLSNAADRANSGKCHYMATIVAIMAIVLGFFHIITP
jgi:hypothetical protein